MKLDRKFLLIAPATVLLIIVVGLLYTTTQLRLMVAASDNLPQRLAFIQAVEQGKRQLAPAKAAQIVRLSLEAEEFRSEAITAANHLLLTLAAMMFGCTALIFWVIKGTPRTLPLRGPVLFHVKPSPGSP
jgi:hypothetical protein